MSCSILDHSLQYWVPKFISGQLFVFYICFADKDFFGARSSLWEIDTARHHHYCPPVSRSLCLFKLI
ncbi:unnamed protein product [Trifolium pratense]|nr:unnamed protein product [Trifolium pratense]